MSVASQLEKDGVNIEMMLMRRRLDEWGMMVGGKEKKREMVGVVG